MQFFAYIAGMFMVIMSIANAHVRTNGAYGKDAAMFLAGVAIMALVLMQ
jgi:hypothetical protein